MRKLILIFLILVMGISMKAQPVLNTRNIVLITLDGLRWQEVFNGADSMLINRAVRSGRIPEYYKRYWRQDPVKRREMLMPFLWGTVNTRGQLHGNRMKGSMVNVRNPYWFSYPGYSEILCGYADERINSNEYGPNPNLNLLEVIDRQKEFSGKVAAFASWDAFNDILNEERSEMLVNAGFEKLDYGNKNPAITVLSKIQTELPVLFDGIRLDAVTFNLGFEYLKTEKPRVLYIALDETDDFGHDGRYDLYLNSARQADEFLREIWEWIQQTPEYSNKTTLWITCDHGRGEGPEKWRDHGKETPHSDETWFAVIGPDTPAAGEMSGGQYYNDQFAKTMAALLGIDFKTGKPAGNVIPGVSESR
ncbi:MAG: alkaline phosphatase family protein [Bacteroidales bacterium]|nr:alkaline phosphatase family protein [Bacteroidales bacterium]